MIIKTSYMIRLMLVLCAMMALASVLLSGILALGYYSYLPQADTWDHVDFFVQAARSHLDIPYLFHRHNGLHLIAIPKLVYFLDITLMHGTGQLVAAVSLAFVLLTTLLVCRMILVTPDITRRTAAGMVALAVVLLASPLQAESLINPANLQWSIFAFTITFTAFCLHYFCDPAQGKPAQRNWLIASITGLLLSALTSASALLTFAPFILVLLMYQKGIRYILSRLFALCLIFLIIGILYECLRNLFFTSLPTLVVALADPLADNNFHASLQELGEAINKDVLKFYAYYLTNIVIFVVSYLSPLATVTKNPTTSVILTFINLLCFFIICVHIYQKNRKLPVFFLYLFFCLVTIAIATALVRSFTVGGFNSRFINLPILLNFAILFLLAITLESPWSRNIFRASIFIYMASFTWINTRGATDYLFSRNHLRLTPVAYALDIRHWALVEELPGFKTGAFDYDVVMEKKEQLKAEGIGIYSSTAYRQVGHTIDENNTRKEIQCNYTIENVTKLNEQPSYGMDGSTYSVDGTNMTHIWISDPTHRVIGIGNPVVHRHGIYNSLFAAKTWTALFNPALGKVFNAVDVYAYNEKTICQPYTVKLP